ncbi:hypothetical protein DFH06DRAFT_1127026 [Mycena polygramma]|nr:hypothetical protein DFH06DRAFT_1127026 [Mycena polygramma]
MSTRSTGAPPAYSPTASPSEPPPTASPSEPRYRYQTPTESGYTSDWSLAASKTQGVSGASPVRLHKKSKSRRTCKAYAVFVGKVPGPYRHWHEVQPLINRVPGNIQQGYHSYEAAEAAHEYARVRGWTRVATGGPPSAPPTVSVIPRLPTPHIDSDGINPLHRDDDGPEQGIWYIVYAGITPGIYQSSLECLLNTVGIPGAVHNSCNSKDVAEFRFNEAVAGGRIRFITPSYTT